MKYYGKCLFVCWLLTMPATGLLAVLLGFENGWTGKVHPPMERFFDYAIPVPVYAGTSHLFSWPFTFGPAMLLMWARARIFLLPIYALASLVYLRLSWNSFVTVDNFQFESFSLVDLLFAWLAVLVSYCLALLTRNTHSNLK